MDGLRCNGCGACRICGHGWQRLAMACDSARREAGNGRGIATAGHGLPAHGSNAGRETATAGHGWQPDTGARLATARNGWQPDTGGRARGWPQMSLERPCAGGALA